MCGRFTLTATPEALAREFDLPEPETLAPRYNIAPLQPIAVVRAGPHGRRLDRLRWGLVPSWADDPKIGSRMINARSERAATAPAFRAALRARRALVPASGFFEWKREKRGSRPFLARPVGGGLFAMAALWERWTADAGEPLESCTILTAAASAEVAAIHDRMPVIVPRADYARWLDPTLRDPSAIADLLRPAPDGALALVEVSRVVNDARHDAPDCLAPAAAAEGADTLF